MKEYYEARAREYDEWWLGEGRFRERDRPGWFEEVARLLGTIASLPPARTLDVACGSGFLTRHLHGEVVGLDQSQGMVEVATRQAPAARVVQGDALSLPFEDRAFERLFTGHFYGHLEGDDRQRFLAEARRVARELVVVDSALHDGVEPEERQERILNDGSRWQVYKRYFEAQRLLDELGGGETLFAGRWFVAVRA
jgi:demethylmenaquinone methyltransferase/2-methoxy-6-polyprenyl-1,4-benzoquinol methylase